MLFELDSLTMFLPIAKRILFLPQSLKWKMVVVETQLVLKGPISYFHDFTEGNCYSKKTPILSKIIPM